MTPDQLGSGQIPFRLQLGVTGHRNITDNVTLRTVVCAEINKLVEQLSERCETPVVLSVVSPLAEGADRLVARCVLDMPDSRLDALLPLPVDDYMHDFETPQSRADFEDLLDRADAVEELASTGTRTDAYTAVGRIVVDRCDVLVAIWDGEPARGAGGTAEIVKYARSQSVPVLWINPSGASAEQEEPTDLGAIEAELVDFDGYNLAQITNTRFVDETGRVAASRIAAMGDIDSEGLRACVDWSTPFYIRADLLALRYQQRYVRLSAAVFLLSAAAVAVLAGQVVLWPDREELALIEATILFVVLGIVLTGRRLQLHDRWIACRFLAERFRGACFLNAAGVRRRSITGHGSLAHRAEAWMSRAFQEVWRDAPQDTQTPTTVRRDFISRGWINDQLGYHGRASRRHQRADDTLDMAIMALFAATVLAAILHGFGIGHDQHIGDRSLVDYLTVAALAMPALAAALGGIQIEREHHRNAERSKRIAAQLKLRQDDLIKIEADGSTPTTDLETLQSATIATEELMVEDTQDWFTVMRFHDFDLKA